MRTYLHIRMNPKNVSGNEYNELVAKYRLPQYQFIIDFVHDVDKYDIKEIDRDKFNNMLN